MLYMQHFMSKISAKMSLQSLKHVQLLGAPPPDPRFGGGFAPLTPPRALPLDPAGGLSSPRPPIITYPGFPMVKVVL